MVSVDDVAAAILERTGPLDSLKLQKLVYYTQGWHLAWTDEPLFDAPIEAWRDGPVVPGLFKRHQGRYTVHSLPGSHPETLGDRALAIVDFVVGFYGRLTGAELRDRTHDEEPWEKARADAGLGPGQWGNATIGRPLMRDFFRRQPPFEQGWYWTPGWQAGEREADEDIEAGRTTLFKSDEDFLSSLQ